MAIWRSFISCFSTNYSVAVFDFPGQGRSRILSGPSVVSLEEQLTVLHQVVQLSHRDNPVFLASASWGTIVAATYAARYPAAVDKMILGSFGMKPNRALLEVIGEGKKMVNENKGNQLGQLIVERFGQHLSQPYRDRIHKQFKHMSQEQVMVFYAHSEFIENARDVEDVVDLRNIKAKTLIVNGEYDNIIDLGDAALAALRIPNCEVEIIRGVGHFLHHEREDILNIYREFLAR